MIDLVDHQDIGPNPPDDRGRGRHLLIVARQLLGLQLTDVEQRDPQRRAHRRLVRGAGRRIALGSRARQGSAQDQRYRPSHLLRPIALDHSL